VAVTDGVLEAFDVEGCKEDITGSSSRRRLVPRVELSFKFNCVALMRIWCLDVCQKLAESKG